jgi:hypothetical protein
VGERRSGLTIASLLAGAWRPAPAPPALTEEELAGVLALLLRVGAGGLAWWKVRESALASTAPGTELQQAYRLHTLQVARLERQTAELFDRFSGRGVTAVLVKGWGIGRHYPHKGIRPYGDVDLYLLPGDLAGAEAALGEMEEPASVELHTEYNLPFDRTVKELLDASQLAPLGETPVRLPCDEDHLRLLCLHALSHSCWRPIWLADIGVALEQRSDHFDWEQFLRGDARHTEWALGTIALAAELLDARIEGTPAAGVGPLPRWLVPAVLDEWERGTGDSIRAPAAGVVRAALSEPAEAARVLSSYWRSPLQATLALRAPLNAAPRLPYQLLATLQRIPRTLLQALRLRP